MSFLSTLFCCFDGDESNRKESSKISATATSNTSKSVSSNTTAHTRPKPPKLTKTQSNLQKAFAHTNSSLNLAKADQSKIPLDLDKNKTSTEPTYSQKSSKDTPMLDSTSTAFQSPEYKELMNDLSGEKESTDSLKNDDDSINIQENQTQGTDDTAVIANVHKAEHDLPESKEDDLNPISNLNEGSAMDIDTGKLIYENQFGIDLTKLLSNQTVSPSGWLLGEQPKKLKGKKCLVLDLDETLVHSSFKFVRQCDFVIPVEIENQIHNVYVIKRPGVDKFLKRVCEIFEVVVFTASVSRYGDPLLDILDKHKAIHHRLFRDSCYNYQGNYIKNLSQMGRPLEDLIIIDNSPASYVFHPQHAVPISSWFSDSHDCELTDLLPFLEDLAQSDVDDVRLVLDINI